MRMTLPMTFVTAALLTAAPAWAQNEIAANTTVTNVPAPVDNTVAPAPLPTDNMAAPVTTTETTTTDTYTTPEPAPEEQRSFPWGVLGLLGLLGLIPRLRRR